MNESVMIRITTALATKAKCRICSSNLVTTHKERAVTTIIPGLEEMEQVPEKAEDIESFNNRTKKKRGEYIYIPTDL